jgi:hypothetical protein
MSVQVIFSLPTVPVLREVGAIVIKHGQLDHVRRLVIKRMLGISLNDAAYEYETKGMSSKLDDKIRKKFRTSRLSSARKTELVRLLTEIKRVTKIRNTLVHSVWAREARKPLMLRDKRALHPVPSSAVLKQCLVDIGNARDQLNKLTKVLL